MVRKNKQYAPMSGAEEGRGSCEPSGERQDEEAFDRFFDDSVVCATVTNPDNGSIQVWRLALASRDIAPPIMAGGEVATHHIYRSQPFMCGIMYRKTSTRKNIFPLLACVCV